MLRNLLGQSKPVVTEADVHVVGAGIAGLIAATRLARAGLRVIVSESGGERQIEDTHPLNEVVHLRSEYRGAQEGRFRCLGGTSTRWGGAMIPFLAADMAGAGDKSWPLRHEELLAHRQAVEDLFRLPKGSYEEPELAVARDGEPIAYMPRLAKWPPFMRRNVASLFREEIHASTGPEIWLNATATSFTFAPSGRLASVSAQAPDGSRLTVTAAETILAAGAIESTRLLLLMDLQHGRRIFAPGDVLGRYFHDHLSVQVGTVEATDRAAINRINGFRFENGGMRNLRFEQCEDPVARAAAPAGFAHIKAGNTEGTGFDFLRSFYQSVQRRSLPDAATVLGLTRSLPWLVRAAWWYRREHRLLYPDDAELELHVVIEQTPRRTNRIGLSEARVDRFEQPLATIEWSVDEQDKSSLAAFSSKFVNFWAGSSLADIGALSLRDPDAVAQELAGEGGIYHPGGSTRMGKDAGSGVVDRDFVTFAIPNLSVLATSAFPSGGGANPTMMLMMAVLRAVERIERKLNSRT